MKTIINNVRYRIFVFFLKILVILYTDYYVDQFQTLRTKGKYGSIFIRLGRSLPDSEIEYSIEI